MIKVIWEKEEGQVEKQKEIVHFKVGYDNTDHFSFVCPDCRSIATVTEVAIDTKVKKGNLPVIFFWLYCGKCRQEGHRKIYLTGYDDRVRDYKESLK